MPQIGIFWLVLTNKCNNRCVWCYAEGDFGEKIISLKKAKRIFDLMADSGARRCVLIGGEPTCCLFLTRLIKYGTKKGIKVFMVTNGRTLSDLAYMRKLVKSGLKGMNISIEGSNAHIHDKVTRIKGSFNQTVKAIDNCIAEKVNFATITTISSENLKDLVKLMDFLKSKGVKRVTYNLCGPTIANADSPYVLKPKAMIKTIEKLYLHAKDIKIKTRFSTPVAKCLFNQKILKDMLTDEAIAKGKSCQVFDGKGCVFNYDGGIMPCTHWIGLYIGNVFVDGLSDARKFKDFWNNGKPQELRAKMMKYPSKKCSKCEQWGSACVGGCPLFWLKFNAKEEIKGFDGTHLGRARCE